jgi:hypothetical protein
VYHLDILTPILLFVVIIELWAVVLKLDAILKAGKD